jgi:CRISPR system Cascade subunit CasE
VNGSLHLIHVPAVMNELARFAHARNRGPIVRRRRDGREIESGLDEGRALHHLLDETFGPGALRPFRFMVAPGKAHGAIYAYSRQSKEALLTTARETAPPEGGRVLGLDRMSTREMPVSWTPGRRLAFDIRIRPVVRVRANLADPRKPGAVYRAGAELDAFFVEAQRSHPEGRPRIVNGQPQASAMVAAERTREAVYRDWLAARLGTAAMLDPERTTLQRFERTRVARAGGAPEGPDATIHGELEVGDPAAFARVLADGIGRHRAYGYGMLLLRPVRRTSRGILC